MPKPTPRRERIRSQGKNYRQEIQASKIRKMARDLNKMEKRLKDLEDKAK